ncbi:MAG: acyltransferase family protein [Rubripirellula sp.]
MDVLPLHQTEPTPPAADSNVRSAAPRTNFAGLDAVRALAGLSVVLLHSCVPYLRHPMPGLCWPVRDGSNRAIDVLFWSIELFIMPLFLVLAGFFAWQTLQRRGPKTLVKHRAKRLLIPLIFGIVFVLPFDLYAWVIGWVAEGVVPAVKLKSLKFDGVVDKDLWGLSHLWFIQYLFLYILGVAGFAWAQRRYPSILRYRPSLPFTIGLGLVIGSAVLFLHPEVVWGFQHSFLPFASKWIYSGVFFVFGVLLAVHDGDLKWLTRRAPQMVIPACLATVTALAMGAWQLGVWESADSMVNQASNPLASMLLAVATTLGALLVTLAIVGLAVRNIQRVPVAISYLAAASFWVYIVHHPVVGLVHLDLKWTVPGLPSVLKVAAAFVVTCTFALLTYEALVRRTALGRLLGFAWEIPGRQTESDSSLLSMENHRVPNADASEPQHAGDDDEAPGTTRRAA